MQPTAPQQFEAAMSDRVAEPDRVADGIWSIPIPMPDPHNPYSFCYAVQGGDGSLHLLDPGYDTDDNWSMLAGALKEFGLTVEDTESVFVSHLHPDHLGMADRVRGRSGARVVMLRREQDAAVRLAEGPGDVEAQFEAWGVPEVRRDELRVLSRMGADRPALRADELLEDGDHWAVSGRDLEVLWTPGHTPGHACVLDHGASVLFSGDHVLPRIYPGIGLGGRTESNPIADYFRSLDRVGALDHAEVAPGHGYRFRGVVERSEEIRAHHLRRAREAARAISERPDASVYEVASRLPWTAGWQNMTGFFLYSALSQTELHLGFVTSPEFLDRAGPA